MDDKIKILVVEDEMIIGAKISMQLTNLGYEVSGLLPRGEDVQAHIATNKPDIILLDINLKGRLDGIETAKLISLQDKIPIIYLTANSDEATFNRAKTTKPAAFISKPFKQLDLQRAIELTISRMDESVPAPGIGETEEEQGQEERPHFLYDRMFVRCKERMVKIMYEDVLFIEAVRNYSRIITKNQEYLLSITLKIIEDKLPPSVFVRIHRTYLANINMIDEVGENHVIIGQKEIPMSSGLKDNLLQRITKF
jgi:DNA-binding LytR/AlgR family response regulator